MQYNPSQIEEKWKNFWKENDTYKVSNDSDKPKYYVLDMFPYPSGAGLHVGHPLGYIASDIYARYKTLKGFNVLHPMGFDAFGLPAEQYAVQTGVHPAVSTDQNIKVYKSQLANLGFNYDWSRQVKTCEPKYYKWTQWIFLEIFKHYYNTAEQKAKPLTELITQFEQNGNADINAHHTCDIIFTADEWKDMTPKQKDEVLMNYRLAFRKEGYVNWCEELNTVLANDEVKDGFSERGGHPVEKRVLMQWCLRITAYANRLLSDMQNLEWSDALKAMQKNWIGKSTGAQIFFNIKRSTEKIEVFTTRPDTIFGATYMVLAPEHDLVASLTSEDQKEEVAAYLNYVNSRSERERMSDVKTVTGAFIGAYAIHPFTNEPMPIYIGEYVLKDYGTGAIMAVPSDDERDHRFAEKFGLPIIEVVDQSNHPKAERGDKIGTMINSDFLNGMKVKDAIKAASNKIHEKGIGKRQVNFRLRDANFSRQRYWGEPFPIKYDKDQVAIPRTLEELPLTLPEIDDYKSASGGKSPLFNAKDWVNEGNYTKETDTMPGYAGSSWYFLRYMDANNDQEFVSQHAVNYWQDVDLYIGGTEHAVGHLMYSRFWHKFLYDKGLVPTNEPFKKLVNQGMIQGVIEFIYLLKEKQDGYSKFMCAGLIDKNNLQEDVVKIPVHIDFINEYGSPNSFLNIDSIKKFMDWRPEYKDAIFECTKGVYHKGNFTPFGEYIDTHLVSVSEVGKMSKRYFNVVNPDDVVAKYGADCFRMYEMFLGPIEQSKPWDTKGIDGVSKFLRKLWSLFYTEEGTWLPNDTAATKENLKTLHATIKKVTRDIEQLSLNTSVSAFMVCVNEFKKQGCTNKDILSQLLQILAPFAPFTTEELWGKLGNTNSIHHSDFPVFDEKHLIEDELILPLSINGKKRGDLTIPNGMSKEEIEAMARGHEITQKWLEGKDIKKIIVVPGRMVNVVM